MADSLENGMRQVLLSLGAVTAIAGTRIRPHKLSEEDDLRDPPEGQGPAIIIDVVRDDTAEDLSDDDPREGTARFEVACIALTKQAAHDLAEAVRTNGTDPGTGLAGYRGAAGDLEFDPCTIVGTSHEFEPADEKSDEGDWYLEVLQCEVWYRRP